MEGQDQLVPRSSKPSASAVSAINKRRSALNGINQSSREKLIERLRRRPNPNAPEVFASTGLTSSKGTISAAFKKFFSFDPSEYRLKLDALSALNNTLNRGQFSWVELEEFVRDVTVDELENLAETLETCYNETWSEKNDFVDDVLSLMVVIVGITVEPPKPGEPENYQFPDVLTEKLMQTSLPNLMIWIISESTENVTIELAYTICTCIGNFCWVRSARQWFVKEGQVLRVLSEYISRNKSYVDSAVWVLQLLMSDSTDYRPEWIQPLNNVLPILYRDLISTSPDTPQAKISSDLFMLTGDFFNHPAIKQQGTASVEVFDLISDATACLTNQSRKTFSGMCALFSETDIYSYMISQSTLVNYVEMIITLTSLGKTSTANWLRFLHNFLISMYKEGTLEANKLFPSPFVNDFLFRSLSIMKNDVWIEALYLWFAMLQACTTVEEVHDLFEYESDFNGVETLHLALLYPFAPIQNAALKALSYVIRLCLSVDYRVGRPGRHFLFRFVFESPIQSCIEDMQQTFESDELIPIADALDSVVRKSEFDADAEIDDYSESIRFTTHATSFSGYSISDEF